MPVYLTCATPILFSIISYNFICFPMILHDFSRTFNDFQWFANVFSRDFFKDKQERPVLLQDLFETKWTLVWISLIFSLIYQNHIVTISVFVFGCVGNGVGVGVVGLDTSRYWADVEPKEYIILCYTFAGREIEGACQIDWSQSLDAWSSRVVDGGTIQSCGASKTS